MKHHPIIFAIGECVPTISIAYKPYYTYKNAGALKIFGLEKYNMDLDKDDYYDSFRELFTDLIDKREKLIKLMKQTLESLKPRREKLFKIIDNILKN